MTEFLKTEKKLRIHISIYENHFKVKHKAMLEKAASKDSKSYVTRYNQVYKNLNL